ncbi:uncharacterized protein LOC134801052 [Cydia splendana]|uniref:uncharacterized protein LOC134801052 n=1 Tax=Cydia splendana TaxID=1100963 RepID=UPI0028F47274
MYYPLLGITLICYVSADLNRVQVSPKFLQNALAKSKKDMKVKESDTYFDKPDNKMLIPVTPEEIQATKKRLKKHPKSTIQKIIARNKKNKKMMSHRLTTKPTLPPASYDVEEFDERDDDPTTQAALKFGKKIKKRNNKVLKYHSQIQKMPNRISPKAKRTKRDTDRDNTIIFQDFDEFEFLDNKKDYDLVRTHFKKYW